MWTAHLEWIIMHIIIGLLLIALVAYLALGFFRGWNKKEEYTRPSIGPKDGFDAPPILRGKDVSYNPSMEGSSAGGLPVSALGKSGRGRHGSEPQDEKE